MKNCWNLPPFLIQLWRGVLIHPDRNKELTCGVKSQVRSGTHCVHLDVTTLTISGDQLTNIWAKILAQLFCRIYVQVFHTLLVEYIIINVSDDGCYWHHKYHARQDRKYNCTDHLLRLNLESYLDVLKHSAATRSNNFYQGVFHFNIKPGVRLLVGLKEAVFKGAPISLLWWYQKLLSLSFLESCPLECQ